MDIPDAGQRYTCCSPCSSNWAAFTLAPRFGDAVQRLVVKMMFVAAEAIGVGAARPGGR